MAGRSAGRRSSLGPDTIIRGPPSYRLVRSIGFGHFGSVYEVIDIDSGVSFALKMGASGHPSIQREFSIFQALCDDREHFPYVLSLGTTRRHHFFVMELLGPTIHRVRSACPKGKFTKSTATRISLKMLDAIEACHKRNVVHRDIKPSNFAFRVPESEHVVLFDFGLARGIFDPETGEHFPEERTEGLVGTCRYQSFHGPQEIPITRRDDLISWFYCLVEMVEGALPWPGKEDREETYRMKMAMSPAKLARNLPPEFLSIWQYVCALKFAEAPDYDWIRGKIEEALVGKENDPLDWLLLSHQSIQALWAHEKVPPPDDESVCGIA
jgi:serine/threonine protein kinase